MNRMGTLYLIPAPLSEAPLATAIPQGVVEVIQKVRFFVVEELRTARRYLSAAGLKGQIDELLFFVLNEHTKNEELNVMLQPLLEGVDVGLLSEAGLPAVADPGALLVSLAHHKGVRVVPLTGPCSMTLALMASGLNGQSFAFVGYLPVNQQERKIRIRQLEKRAIEEGQSQIFIETPYRNVSLFGDLIEVCAKQTQLNVSANLTAPDAFIATKTIALWQRTPLPPIHKVPAVFIIGGHK